MEKRQAINFKICSLFGIVCLQFLVVLLSCHFAMNVINGYQNYCPERMMQVFVGIISLCSIGALYLIFEINRLVKVENEFRINQLLLKKSQELITVLSSHRHDFRNHLQVVLGLIQLKRAQSAEDYIKEVTKQLSDESVTANKIKNLEVAALLLTKKAQAEEQDIKLLLDSETDLAKLAIPATDISRILGNLIDNALDAVGSLPEGEDRAIEVKFLENQTEYLISVNNKLPIIPPEKQEVIFQQGYTTKGLSGSGLGLYIVKELTEKHGGQAVLKSDKETGTSFVLKFPKN